MVGIFQFIGMLITGVDIENINGEISTINQLTISCFDLLGTFLILFIFMKVVDKEKFINLGFHTNERFSEFYLGVVLGAILILIGYFILMALNQIKFEKIVFNPSELISSIILFFIVAIVEETLFRGYVLRNLMISANKYVALIISSLLFTIMHGFNPNIEYLGIINLFLAGIFLGISYIHTKNLWFPIALHFSWNLFQTHFGFNVSGQNSYSLIEFKIMENNMFNGGTFGFEGSILSIIFLLFSIVGIELYFTKKHSGK
jgi:membrane protease YdiL (CAAX protease family)